MNITLRKNPQLNLEDVAQKHAQARPVPSIRLPENADAEFTEVFRQARAPLKAEQGLARQTTDMGALSAGALIEKERNTISLRSED